MIFPQGLEIGEKLLWKSKNPITSDNTHIPKKVFTILLVAQENRQTNKNIQTNKKVTDFKDYRVDMLFTLYLTVSGIIILSLVRKIKLMIRALSATDGQTYLFIEKNVLEFIKSLWNKNIIETYRLE